MIDRTFIETQFPIAQLSAESYRERKANLGQTLTRLGKWWGRKPLILVRAAILGMLMPASDDPHRDRDVYLKLLTMDPDGQWRRRKGKVSDRQLLQHAPAHQGAWKAASKEEREELREEIWDSLDEKARAALEAARRFPLTREAFAALPYDERVKSCVRPEQIDGPDAAAWAAINEHLGTSAKSLPELVDELGRRSFGHQPRVGDCFCGGGSIPFEAARIGCDAFGSDLNPVAALLTWASLHLVGGGKEVQARVQAAQDRAFQVAARDVEGWGIERSEEGWQAEAYLYCVEVRPPGCDYLIPLAPSWVIGERSKVIARLGRPPRGDRLTIEIETHPPAAAWAQAKNGTIVDSRVIDPVEPNRSWPVEQLRGPEGLRLWEKQDLVPRPDDALQERLYCIRWRKPDGAQVYRAPTAFDLKTEKKVLKLLSERMEAWWGKGFLPSMTIPIDGAETARLHRERGWTHWHHLFTPRQLLVNGVLCEKMARESAKSTELKVAGALAAGRLANWNSRLSAWLSQATNEKGDQVFNNQALNPLFSYSTRASTKLDTTLPILPGSPARDHSLKAQIDVMDARDLKSHCDVWITDPPYADAINYHELGDFFLAWYEKHLPRCFPEWHADGRHALAVRGAGEDFKKSMVEIYANLARHMPDSGLQLVMFTHQNPAVWADLGMILWAAGLRVTAAWTIATETPASGIKKGSYVQGTVLLVLRKRLSEEHGFLDEVYPLVEDEVRRQIDSMRALDEGGEPNFGDSDYQLAAYAAALRVLTQYQTLDGQDVTHELFRAQPEASTENPTETDAAAGKSKAKAKGKGRGRKKRAPAATKSRFEQVIDRAIEIACDYLIPRGLDGVWRGLGPDERLYLRALDVESRGEHRQGVYQELARGFGVREVKRILSTDKANGARVRTPAAFGKRDLEGDGFAGTKLRKLLFAIDATHAKESPEQGLQYLRHEMKDYWAERQRFIAILDWLAELSRAEGMEHWQADSEAARLLAGRLRSDHG